MRNIFIYTWFKVNQAAIARTLCVKKEIKNNDCGGCCVLKEKLEKENAGEGNMSLEQKQGEIVFFVFQTIRSTFFFNNNYNKVFYNPYDASVLNGYYSTTFQPPDFI